MKKVLKAILGIIGGLYLLLIIFITFCLLCYNKYKVTEFKGKTFVIIDDKSDMYKDGDLVIFNREPNDEIKVNDVIFFYEVTGGEASINTGTVTESEKITDTETTFTINKVHKISSETVIGTTKNAKVHHKVGKLLYVFESQYGFLILVILPALFLFFYSVYVFFKELKGPKDDDDDEGKEKPVEKDKKEEPVKEDKTEEAPIQVKKTEEKSNDEQLPKVLVRPNKQKLERPINKTEENDNNN